MGDVIRLMSGKSADEGNHTGMTTLWRTSIVMDDDREPEIRVGETLVDPSLACRVVLVLGVYSGIFRG